MTVYPIRNLYLLSRETNDLRPVEIAEDGGLITTGSTHALGHEGKIFVFFHNMSVSLGNDFDFLVKTNAILCHVVPAGSVSAESYLNYYNAPTVSANGTEITGYSVVSEASPKTPTTQIFHTPTVTDVGTHEDRQEFFAARQFGNEIPEVDEKIIKPSRLYLLRLHAVAGLNANIRLIVHEPGNTS